MLDFQRMKKFVVPAILLVLVVLLFVFLKADPFEPRLDGTAYLSVREEIDALNMDAFVASDDAEKQTVLQKRDSLWGVLVAMRNLEAGDVPAKTAPVKAAPAAVKKEQAESGSNVFVYVIGGLIVLIVILGAVFLFLRNRQEAITRQLEKIREENRFKTPKGGLDDPTFVDRTRVHRRSIIDDVKAPEEAPSDSSVPISDNVEFENAKGEVEKPVLRPTARERITNAMQALSDTLAGLRVPRGVHRAPERANKVKAQSHNTLSTEAVPKPNPLEMTRFDRERADKEKVLQLNRRGLTPSEIARRTQLSEEQVETVIRIKRETGE